MWWMCLLWVKNINFVYKNKEKCAIIKLSVVVNRFDYILIFSSIFLWNYQNEKKIGTP